MERQSPSAYLCIFFRLSNFYFCMTLLQVSLALMIILALATDWIQIVSLIQIWIAFFLSLDLMIKYFSEEKVFWTRFQNKIDMAIFFMVCFSIILDLAYTQEIHHSNSLIGALMMIGRYILQFYRVTSLIKTSVQLRKQNQDCEIEIKEEIELQEMAE